MCISGGMTSGFGTKCFSSLAFKNITSKIQKLLALKKRSMPLGHQQYQKIRVRKVHDNPLNQELATSAERQHFKLFSIIDVDTVAECE